MNDREGQYPTSLHDVHTQTPKHYHLRASALMQWEELMRRQYRSGDLCVLAKGHHASKALNNRTGAEPRARIPSKPVAQRGVNYRP